MCISMFLFVIVGKASSFEEEDGTGTGKNEIRVQLGRGDLGNRLTCRSENDALPANQPLRKSVQVDINCKYNVLLNQSKFWEQHTTVNAMLKYFFKHSYQFYFRKFK